MGSSTNYTENVLLGHIVHSAYTPPAVVYMGLSTGDPGEAATGANCSEVITTYNYSRAVITFLAAADRKIVQDAQVDFPLASGPWGTVGYWFLSDSPNPGEGNVLAYGQFTKTFEPKQGNTPRVPAGTVYVEFSVETGVGFTTSCANSLLNLMFRNTAYASPASNLY